jgi:uncharacterized membrane protein (Fun14 family)
MLFQEIEMIDFFTQLLLSLGIGGFGGFFIGFLTKKIIKILMIIAGLYLLSLFYLMNMKIITIDLTQLLATSSDIITQIINFLLQTLPYLPISGSFTLGFVLGITKG